MQVGAVIRIAGHGYRLAARAFIPALPYALAFAGAASLALTVGDWYPIADHWPFVGAAVCITAYVLGCFLSAKIYGAILRTGPKFPARDDVTNLALANAAAYGLFGLLSFFLGFFLVMLPGIFVAQSGRLTSEQVENDPEAVVDAFEAVMAGPAGYVVTGALILAGLLLAYIAIRLFLYGITTFARGEIRVLATWEWTKKSWPETALICLLIYIPTGALIVLAWLQLPQLAEAGRTVQIFALLLSAYPALLVGHGSATKVYLEVAPNLSAAASKPAEY